MLYPERDRKLKRLQHKLMREKVQELRGDSANSSGISSRRRHRDSRDSDDRPGAALGRRTEIGSGGRGKRPSDHKERGGYGVRDGYRDEDDEDEDVEGEGYLDSESGSSLGLDELSDAGSASAASSNTMIMSDDESELGHSDGGSQSGEFMATFSRPLFFIFSSLDSSTYYILSILLFHLFKIRIV